MNCIKLSKVFLWNLLALALFLLIPEFLVRLLDQSNGRRTLTDFKELSVRRKAYAANAGEYDLVNKVGCKYPKIVTSTIQGLSDGSSIKYEKMNWSCAGVTSKNWKRLTLYQPKFADRHVHIFGGSTAWGTGSSDKNTIPSLLQADINRKFPQEYIRVVNHGFPSLVATQQLQKLKQAAIKRGDIVIFYDGGNDVVQSAIYNMPHGTIIGYNREHKIRFLFSGIRKWMADYSAFYNYLSNKKNIFLNGGIDQSSDTHYCKDLEILKQKRAAGQENSLFSVYFESIIQARKYAINSGAEFLHFLQPVASSSHQMNSGSDDEYFRAIHNGNLCFSRFFGESYSKLSSEYATKIPLINGHSLSSAFTHSQEEPMEPIHFFIDWIHTSPSGNKVIARKIFHTLLPLLEPK